MELNIKDWKYFKVCDLFDLSGIRGPLVSLSDYDEGTVPVVSTTEKNNGVIGYFDVSGKYNNKITCSFNGACGYFSYHKNSFNANSDVGILKEKFNLNMPIAMFLITILNQLSFKYQYGRKLNSERLGKELIKLPADAKGQPDWCFMERYIKSLNYKPINTENRGGGVVICYRWDE